MEPALSPIPALFDFALAAILVALAWFTLRAGDLFRCCVLFMVFGAVMAIAWLRLRAPDIALAEAAIGSGLTGALLLGALRGLGRRARDGDTETEAPE